MEGRFRIIAVERHGGVLRPAVFVSIIVLRKCRRRFNFHAHVWSKRLQHEIARWSWNRSRARSGIPCDRC